MNNYNKNYSDDKKRIEGWLSSNCHKLFTLVVTFWITINMLFENGSYKNEELSIFKTSEELIKGKSSEGKSLLSVAGGLNDESESKKDNHNQKKEYPLGLNNLLLAGEKIFPFRSTTEFENFYLLDCLIDWQRMMLEESRNGRPVNLFSKNFNGYSTTPFTLALLQKINENNPLKRVGVFEVLYHSNENNDCNSCRSDIFVKDKMSSTTAEELEITLKRQILSLIKSKITDKVYIFLVSLIDCAYLENKGHVAVLVISGGSNNLRAYYCDSGGYDMPNVLRHVLITKLHIKANNIGYSTFCQQGTRGFCPMFVLENAIIISDLMLKKASFEEISKKLTYHPTRNHLLKSRGVLLIAVRNRFRDSLDREITFFSYSFNKLIDKLERHLSHLILIREDLSKKVSNLKKMKSLLVEVNQDIKKRQVSHYVEKLFTVKGQKVIRFCFCYFSKLNYEYYNYLEAKLIEMLQHNLFILCSGCEEVLRNKITIKKERKNCHLALLNHLTYSLIESPEMFFKSQLLGLTGQIKSTKIKNRNRKECIECNRKWSTNEILRKNYSK